MTDDEFPDRPALDVATILKAGIFDPKAQALNMEWKRAQYGVAESPIEEMMALGFCRLSLDTRGVRLVRNHTNSDYVSGEDYDPDLEIQIFVHRQYPAVHRRLDFAMEGYLNGERMAVLAVECDGHEFHSTPEQIAADRRRDEQLRLLGIETIRFEGREIFKNAAECAERAFDRIVRLIVRAKHAKANTTEGE